jgi:CPA2 family monovalent cation:H+ antiporter-2
MRTLVFGLGLTQVVLTVLGAVLGNLLTTASAWFGVPWDLGWQGAFVLGAAMAMSSTAIVVKLMAERLELESEHGRRVMGVLLFQDLAVVPLLVLIPALGSGGQGLVTALGSALVKAVVLLTLLLVGGQRLMRWWLTLVARRKSEELFMLNLLLVTLGLAWLTEHFGSRWRWAPSWPACWWPKPNTSTRWRPTSGPSTTCCWACSSSPSA